jgi:O-antigen/teichoic acid export membrane protein
MIAPLIAFFLRGAVVGPKGSERSLGASLERDAIATSAREGGRAFYARMRRATAAIFALDLIMLGLSLVLTVVLARALGAAQYGVYAYAIALVAALGIPLRVGLPKLVVREVAAYRARSEWHRMRGLLRWANSTVLISSVVLVAVAWLAAWLGAGATVSPTTITVALALPLLPLAALGAVRSATLSGLHFVVLGKLPEAVVRPAVFLLLLVGGWLAFAGRGLTAPSVVVMDVLATGIAFTVGAAVLRTRLPNEAREGPATYTTHAWRRSTMALALVAGLQFINHRVDILMLGVLRDTAEVGVYQVATRGADCVHLVLMAVNAVLSPTVSSVYASGQFDRLQRLMTQSARLVLLCSLPIGLAFIVWGKWILTTVFGPEFGAGATPLAMLSAGQLVNAAAGSVGLLLTMTGNERYTVRGVGVAAVLNIVLNAVLIPAWGGFGAAVATVTSLVTWNALLVFWAHRRLGIHGTVLGPIGFRRNAR